MNKKFWAALFIADAIANLYGLYIHSGALQNVTKPLLAISLIAYSIAGITSRNNLFFLLIAALFFSLVGDTFLLFEKQAPYWFILGLIGFLLAHIFYILLFIGIKKQNQPEKKINIFFSLLVIVYSVCLFLLLWPSLASLKIPVMIYTTVLSLMVITSFHAFDFAKQLSGKLCMSGALLFLISDSLLAINKFYQSFTAANILIMLSYALAQLLIVVGATKYLNSLIELPKSSKFP